MTTTANAETALRLARTGFAVFPCQEGDGPTGTDGKPDWKAKSPKPKVLWRMQSTTDAAKITAWWQRWPDAAVGLDLAKSRLIVIDADRHDAEADGVEAFGELMAANSFDPDSAPLVATPSEGNHHYFRQPDGAPLGNGEGALPAGINVRGAGGYVIAPGTVMADGRAYELHGDIAEAPDLPSWLVEILTAKRGGNPEEGTRSQNHDTQGFEGGNFSNGTQPTSDAEIEELLSFIPADCSYADWVAVLMAIHAATDGQGLDIADRWSAKGGSKYPGSKALSKKWASFKRHGVTGRTLAQIARQYGADLSAIAIKYKVESAEPVDQDEANRIADRLFNSFEEKRVTRAAAEAKDAADEDTLGGAVDHFDLPPSMLNPSGVVGELTNWICQWTSEPIRIHAVGAALVIIGTLLGRKVYSATRPTSTALYIGTTAPSGMGKQHAQDAIKLALDEVSGSGRHHMGWNVSLPAIALALKENASKVMIADEFADKLIGIRNRNASTSQTAISEGLRSLWGINTGSYSPDVSVSRGDVKVARPCMSFYGAATQRDFSRSLISKDVTNGLFNRFLILPRYEAIVPQAEPTGIMTLPAELKQRLGWLYNCLDDPLQVSLAARGDGFPANPVLVPFSAAAAAMNEENRVLQREMLLASDHDDVLTLYGRYAEQIKRIAMILACGRCPERLAGATIEAHDMKFAKDLVDFSLNQFVLMVRRDMVENWIEANRKAVLAVIRKAKTISRSEVLRRVRSISARDMNDILKLLEEAGCIVSKTERTGGRHAMSYRYLRD